MELYKANTLSFDAKCPSCNLGFYVMTFPKKAKMIKALCPHCKDAIVVEKHILVTYEASKPYNIGIKTMSEELEEENNKIWSRK